LQQPPPMQSLAATFRLTTEGLMYSTWFHPSHYGRMGRVHSVLGGVPPVQQPPPVQCLVAVFRLTTEGLTYLISLTSLTHI